MNRFIHTVLWNLKDGKTVEDYKRIESLIYGLKPLIKEIKDCYMGFSDMEPDESTRQICLVCTFDSEEEYIVYRDHPEHLKVKEQIGILFKDRVVSDVKIEK